MHILFFLKVVDNFGIEFWLGVQFTLKIKCLSFISDQRGYVKYWRILNFWFSKKKKSQLCFRAKEAYELRKKQNKTKDNNNKQQQNVNKNKTKKKTRKQKQKQRQKKNNKMDRW